MSLEWRIQHSQTLSKLLVRAMGLRFQRYLHASSGTHCNSQFLMGVHIVLNGLQVCINMIRHLMMVVDGEMAWVRGGSSGNVSCDHVARNVYSTRLTSGQSMSMFHGDVSSRCNVQTGRDMFHCVFRGRNGARVQIFVIFGQKRLSISTADGHCGRLSFP